VRASLMLAARERTGESDIAVATTPDMGVATPTTCELSRNCHRLSRSASRAVDGSEAQSPAPR
jgi:hypothetical protein